MTKDQTYSEMVAQEMKMKAARATFEPGDEIIFHFKSMGVSTIPLPPAMQQQTGQIIALELNMMHGVFRGETDTCWIVDLMSIQPTVMGAHLRKDGVDLIGVKGKLQAVSGPKLAK